MQKKDENVFSKLTRLFRSGPVVRRKLKNIETTVAVNDDSTSSIKLLHRSANSTYGYITANAYNTQERMGRFQDFQEMEQTAEIATALNVMADESVAQDEKGRTLHIYSNNTAIRDALEELFYNNINVEFNLRPWIRNLIKYGDMFLYNDVSPEHGVINVIPIPVNEIERMEGFDPKDPMAVKFKWSGANHTRSELENWEVTHFRLLGNDMFLPYGSSMLEGTRKIWRQLILIEDAMLVYRIVRSPERRVFYVDVGNMPPDEVDHHVKQIRDQLRSQRVVDQATGRVDLRYSPLNIEEDYIIPNRGDTNTRIETLAGGSNVGTVEDVAYLQKKLFSSLQVPRAYLGYDESLSSKSSLAQEDIRFSRTINMIQRTIISELNKIAIIHLFACGYRNNDLINFNLRLSNPSTIAQQQKLELFRTKFEIAATAPPTLLSRDWIRENVLGLPPEDILQIERELIEDAKAASTIEAAGIDEAMGTEDTLGMPGGGETGGAGSEEVPGQIVAGEEPADDDFLLIEPDFIEDQQENEKHSIKDKNLPIKVQSYIDKYKYNRGRRRTHGPASTHMPDHNKMVGNNLSMKDPHDMAHLRSVGRLKENEIKDDVQNEIVDELDDSKVLINKSNTISPTMTNETHKMLKKIEQRFSPPAISTQHTNDEYDYSKIFSPQKQSGLLNESYIFNNSNIEEIDNIDNLDVFISGDDDE